MTEGVSECVSERVSACTIECVRGCEQASARGLPQSSLENALSRVVCERLKLCMVRE